MSAGRLPASRSYPAGPQLDGGVLASCYGVFRPRHPDKIAWEPLTGHRCGWNPSSSPEPLLSLLPHQNEAWRP